ncbi:hypothetical protein C2S52_011859 [Perilla frutescens var. hirtella]|nr:hypothetical protein C2S52_011859 [Perilla frutescens var. hirtella]
MLGISNPSPIPEESNPTEELNENWLIPMILIDVSDSLLISDLEGVPDDQLCKGSTFWTKDALSIAVGLWNIHHRAEYKVARSNSKRLIIVCKHEDRCPFEVRTTLRETFWIVYKFMEEHTCMNDLSRVAPRQVHAKVIAAYFANKMRGEGQIMKPKDIRAKMLEEFGIRTSYSIALRARNVAIEMIYDGHEDSFKMLPSYLYMLEQANPAEVLNARLLWARRLPICSLIECIRHVIEQWFDSRRARANAHDNALTEEALNKLREEVEKSRAYTVVPTLNSTFKVHDGRQTFIVDLHQKSCKCREFQLDLMSCSHAVAAIMKNGESILDYVSSYYTTHNWRETYEGSVRSLPHQDEWVVPAHIAQQKVTPLIVTRQAGRPSGRRHPSGAEAANRRRRGPRKCIICRDPNHTRNNCPNRDR